MSGAGDLPAQAATLGPAEANPVPQVGPPEVDVTPPPVDDAASLQGNGFPQGGQLAEDLQPRVRSVAAAPPPAKVIADQILDLQPGMSLGQLTGILNILDPDRHKRTAAANLLKSS